MEEPKKFEMAEIVLLMIIALINDGAVLAADAMFPIPILGQITFGMTEVFSLFIGATILIWFTMKLGFDWTTGGAQVFSLLGEEGGLPLRTGAVIFGIFKTNNPKLAALTGKMAGAAAVGVATGGVGAVAGGAALAGEEAAASAGEGAAARSAAQKMSEGALRAEEEGFGKGAARKLAEGAGGGPEEGEEEGGRPGLGGEEYPEPGGSMEKELREQELEEAMGGGQVGELKGIMEERGYKKIIGQADPFSEGKSSRVGLDNENNTIDLRGNE